MSTADWNNRVGREVRRGSRNALLVWGALTALALGGMGTVVRDRSFIDPWAWATVPGIALVVAIWNLGRSAMQWCDITRHPSLRQLARYGDPRTLARDIEADLTTPGDRVEIEAAVFTRRWFAIPTMMGIALAPTDAIVWAYVVEKRYYVKHAFHGATLKEAFFHTRAGDVLQVYGTDAIEGSNVLIDELMNFVATDMPGVVFGYSRSLERLWRKDPRRFLERTSVGQDRSP